jgi:hypothetical protein
MDYLKLLQNSYDMQYSEHTHKMSKLEFLSEYIFDFDTYESEVAELFAAKALQVCYAISNSITFDYIENKDNRIWFLLMCNMPFFKIRITWGTSIRGAFWDTGITLNSCCLSSEGDQIIEEIEFSVEEWNDFINAMIKFSEKE